ncbi:Serine/threonine protein phosphatase 7 long form isogeny [Gossypium australe]|uniref:Serine/threonine protein phosphatase 7 long form isogeny n=1 Tax=Gossypium australe TaxID=47621 RepID=A0A5B6VWN1_9ROSI|nr:Serine/threonine protein phosphatase 7 long form isogeny [Gossypium australe]
MKRNFVRIDAKSSEVEREQHVREYILRIIWGLLLPDKLQNLTLEKQADSVGGQPCWRRCTKRCVGRRNHRKLKSMVACSYYNHRRNISYHFYVFEWTTFIHSHS